MGFNKGEWSELYTFLYLIDNPNLVVVDEKLQQNNNTTFKILEFIINDCVNYKFSENNIIKTPFIGDNKSYSISHISNQHKLLLQKILLSKGKKGAFDIPAIQPLVDDLLDGNKLKGSSSVKGDLKTIVFDSIKNNNLNISYSIKSELGAKATLLNASNHTNFIYEVQDINDSIMEKINKIATKKKSEEGFSSKLLDSCKELKSNNAKFNFIKTESDIFSNNLKLIDSKLDEILSQMLILSYEKNEKDIKNLLSLIITDETSKIYFNKKMCDFASSSSFGMFPSKKWNGKNEVNGGIIIVTKTGEVYLLDLIYFKDIVDKYLIENIKLESPSSSRYKMFQIYKEDGKYYFKLNLQVRFK